MGGWLIDWDGEAGIVGECVVAGVRERDVMSEGVWMLMCDARRIQHPS